MRSAVIIITACALAAFAAPLSDLDASKRSEARRTTESGKRADEYIDYNNAQRRTAEAEPVNRGANSRRGPEDFEANTIGDYDEKRSASPFGRAGAGRRDPYTRGGHRLRRDAEAEPINRINGDKRSAEPEPEPFGRAGAGRRDPEAEPGFTRAKPGNRREAEAEPGFTRAGAGRRDPEAEPGFTRAGAGRRDAQPEPSRVRGGSNNKRIPAPEPDRVRGPQKRTAEAEAAPINRINGD